MVPKTRTTLAIFTTLATVALLLASPSPVEAVDDCSAYLSSYHHGFQISDRSDLDQLLDDDVAEACSDETLYLTSDIDLEGWTTSIQHWFGTLDGNRHEFLDSDADTDEAALLDAPPGPVALIRVVRHGNISGAVYDPSGMFLPPVGSLVGVTLQPITIKNSSSTGQVEGNEFVGGLIGAAYNTAEIKDSYSTAEIRGNTDVGGLIGNGGLSVTIVNSYTTGSISGYSYVDSILTAGGLLGVAQQISIESSFTNGDITGANSLGGLVGWGLGPVEISNSYTTGDIYGSVDIGGTKVGGLVGQNISGTVKITNSFATGNVNGITGDVGALGGSIVDLEITAGLCLETSDGCLDGDGVTGTPVSTSELKSRTILSKDYDWNFSSVWCFSRGMNDGFPVLRAIDFGPGDTNCHSRGGSAFQVTLDPAGGQCNGSTSTQTARFRRHLSLPDATECTRPGFALLGWTRDPGDTDNLLTGRIRNSENLTAVWGELPAAPSTIDVLANFLCRQNCDSALIVWPASNHPSETPIVTLDGTEISCTSQGEVFGLKWCLTSGLAPGSSHTATVAWRNQHGTGTAVRTTFTLN